MIIGIDKGHSINGGTIKILNETTENRKLGNRLITMLKEKGHTIIDCSVDSASNQNTQLSGIVKKANAQKLDLFVSIHFNSFGSGANGTEVFTTTTTSQANKNKAKLMSEKIASSCGFRNRGHKTSSLYVIKNTVAPAMLVEVCFIDNQSDVNKYNMEKVARAMFEVITGTVYTPPAPVKPSAPATGNFKIGTYGKKVKTTDNLNVRVGRGTEHKVLGTLSKGSVVTVNYILPDNRDGKGDSALWGSIDYKGNTGFIHLGFVTPV